MDINEITRIAELMQQFDLTEFLVESEELKLTLRRDTAKAPADAPVAAPPAAEATASPPPPAPAAAADQPTGPDEEEEDQGTTLNSPIVGTFYSAPAADKPPFVRAGDEVTEDTVVCIIEAMKVMNEIKAEMCGRIERVLVENATTVEYGQPLYQITPL